MIELDVLRGVAILLVLAFHSPAERGASGWLRPLDALIHKFGWSGVDLFFVLSGFLIGGLLFSELERTQRLDVGRFLVRRMFRIWPAYYALLCFVLARLTYASGGDFRAAFAAMWPAFVHVQNYLPSARDQLWSLAVEEHFYLALPIFLWLLTRRGPRASLPSIPLTFALLAIGCSAARAALHVTSNIDVRMQTDLAFDALFCGVTLAYFRAHEPALLEAIAKKRTLILSLVWLLFIPAVTLHGVLGVSIGYSATYVAYALILICVVFGDKTDAFGRWFSSRSARWLGFIGASSYSIYLWHRDTSYWAYWAALELSRRLGLPPEPTWCLHTLASVTASVVSGVVLGHLIETPALRLRDRLFPARVPSPTGSEAPFTVSVESGQPAGAIVEWPASTREPTSE